MKNKFLFIDRDGTIIDEPAVDFKVDSFNKLKFKKNVFSSLLNLKNHNYKFVMITNQDGLGTKEFPNSKFYLIQNFIIDVFLSQEIKFCEILICPHYISDNCKCRKPKTEMLIPIFKKYNVDMENSFVIGDRETDIKLAENIGIQGILYGKKHYDWNKIEKKIINNNNFIIIRRKTKETKVKVTLNLEKYIDSNINTGIKFFDHMLCQFAFHSRIFLKIKSVGDICVDDHHTVEDVAITLGQALFKTIQKRVGINRFGFGIVPMDESISRCVLDISGRPYIHFISNLNNVFLGNFNLNMVKHFFSSLSYSMRSTIHIKSNGENDHHICESIFKSFGVAFRNAIFITSNIVQSSKGVLL
ncbi:bifunctional histidinol-phosphatase/imidazoleglycerol-phosphate dehydratase HisB [Buchnera aphidicola (Chaitoregma tattakana)]|uniref:bifunctional histidinol-phosphatase/imidazoleglycerol-phosphate dehydratase HisB n=1 Tax=Buchnera aphidicola TaxID=9 RepID=UPI0031B7EE8B